jgi:hypothetical protein
MKYPNRNPAGVVNDKPIALRLMPCELNDANELAKVAGISRGKLARIAYLRGLPLVKADLSTSVPRATSTGGEVSPSPSGFLTA